MDATSSVSMLTGLVVLATAQPASAAVSRAANHKACQTHAECQMFLQAMTLAMSCASILIGSVAHAQATPACAVGARPLHLWLSGTLATTAGEGSKSKMSQLEEQGILLLISSCLDEAGTTAVPLDALFVAPARKSRGTISCLVHLLLAYHLSVKVGGGSCSFVKRCQCL